MIVVWFIGVILSCLGIWLLKNSRYNQWLSIKDKQPVLKMWALILLMICTIIPIVNIIVGSTVIVGWTLAVITDELRFIKGDNKLVQFLKRPIGLYNSKANRYHRFDHWAKSVIAYKEWVQKRYKPPKDYYSFLQRVGYAEDPRYIHKLKRIVNSNDKRRSLEGSKGNS